MGEQAASHKLDLMGVEGEGGREWWHPLGSHSPPASIPSSRYVQDLAHHFFARCLEAKVVPYVVTKKTVFKWQESFWQV